jgi:hypothetical protein
VQGTISIAEGNPYLVLRAAQDMARVPFPEIRQQVAVNGGCVPQVARVIRLHAGVHIMAALAEASAILVEALR